MKLKTWIFISCLVVVAYCERRSKTQYHLRHLSNENVQALLKKIKPSRFEEILDPILIPRAVGTKGSKKVREYISKFLKDLDWDVQLDSFTDTTPYGPKQFVNIIATLNPKAKRRIIIACHYDSKLNRENTLVTATDSAVPCAMMLNLAEDLAVPLSHARTSADVTLQMVFFDGEEAFVEWTATDSIYGARHLAEKWEKTVYGDGSNELEKIDSFILLDLIGGPNPTFYNYFRDTDVLYNRLRDIEKNLHQMKKLKNHRSPNQYFKPNFMTAGIEDDHIPFYRRGVPVLHLITLPFPKVWHKESDNRENLDFDAIGNLNKIFWTFVVEYLHLVQDDLS